MTKSMPLVRPFDQTGHVGDDERAVVGEATTPRLGMSVVNG